MNRTMCRSMCNLGSQASLAQGRLVCFENHSVVLAVRFWPQRARRIFDDSKIYAESLSFWLFVVAHLCIFVMLLKFYLYRCQCSVLELSDVKYGQKIDWWIFRLFKSLIKFLMVFEKICSLNVEILPFWIFKFLHLYYFTEKSLDFRMQKCICMTNFKENLTKYWNNFIICMLNYSLALCGFNEFLLHRIFINNNRWICSTCIII